MVATSQPVELHKYLHRQKPLWNAIAISYALLGYIGAIILLILPSSILNAAGVIFLAHSLTYSAYLSHEFMHGTIFRGRNGNTIWGTIMLWLNGGCYFGFKTLTLQHIAHHVDRVDVFTFDIPAAMRKLPRSLRGAIVALEWLYFPAVAFWARWRSISAPFWSGDRTEDRLRVALTFLVRSFFFALLGMVSLKALLLYFLAYIGTIHALRWLDAFQHTYEAFLPGTILPKRDRAHEQANTYSNLFSRRHFWLNLLLLNFGYHNAHHALMKCPWHSLHELDRELFPNDDTQHISLRQQLINYHRFRIARLFAGPGATTDELGDRTYEQFYGAVDVSFLILY
jgi:fatty acid desaturase